ncbi:MAG: DASH family cryptochrome [Bacteroidota bacterium]
MPRACNIVWFKNDLRLHDHEALVRACEKELPVLGLFVIDPRWWEPHSLGFPRRGYFWCRFLKQALEDLRARLQARGGTLLIRTGLPEDVVAEEAARHEAYAVYTSEEIAAYEKRQLNEVEKKLSARKIFLHRYAMNTLYHESDIPWPIQRLPDVFTTFRKELEAEATVRMAFEAPQRVAGAVARVADDAQWPCQPEPLAEHPGSVITYAGGEAAAMERVRSYLWEKDLLKTYKETRNGLIGPDYSTKLSPAPALGCISPRYIYQQVKKYEAERVANESTYWLVFELLWRDYFRFVMKKYGVRSFHRDGLRAIAKTWKNDKTAYGRWCQGETGVAFVDANMRELLQTGFMSNRGRQIVASYLTKNLELDWRWGAAWFESRLIDYDVHSNWLNWAYIAGVGNDPRPNRYFNIERQSQTYDPQGLYRQLWLGS